MVHNRKAFVPVVIANRGRESSSTDSVTHHVDQLTEPELYPKNKYLQGKKNDTLLRKDFHYSTFSNV